MLLSFSMAGRSTSSAAKLDAEIAYITGGLAWEASYNIVAPEANDVIDLVGERKRTDFKVNQANHTASESFEIKLRNRKKQPAEIRVVEHLYRWTNWTIKEKSQDFTKTNAQTIEFRVPLKPDEEKTVTYKATYTW